MSELIPIDEIEPGELDQDAPVVPRTLSDDPHTGDGSAGRPGVDLGDDEWKLRKLNRDRLQPLSDPFGNSPQARKTKMRHERSRAQRDEKKRKHRKIVRALVALIVVGVAALGTYLGFSYSTEQWGGYVVPNVIGLSQTNATAELEEKGFAVKYQRVEADEVQGHVVSTDPKPGSRAAAGDPVMIYVSENRRIPQVVGLTREQAVERLGEAGAANVRFQARVLLEEQQDRVLEVLPAEGSIFMSSDEITLVVGEMPTVPDVTGLSEAEAREVLNREGLPVLTDFEPAGFSGRLKAVRTSPAAGERAGENGVTLYMGDPLVAVPRLADYFDADTAHIDAFLERGGFKAKVAYKNKDAHLVARYDDKIGGSIAFCYDPWSQAPSRDKTDLTEIMHDPQRIEGVRLSISPIDSKAVADKLKEAGVEVGGAEVTLGEGEWAEGTTKREEEKPADAGVIEPMLQITSPKVGEAVALEVMGICGFENIAQACTEKDIKLPADTKNEGHVFYCCQGTIDDKIWTVLVRGNKDQGDTAVEVVATCLPAAAYENIDLGPFDNKICNFVAYQDEYVG